MDFSASADFRQSPEFQMESESQIDYSKNLMARAHGGESSVDLRWVCLGFASKLEGKQPELGAPAWLVRYSRSGRTHFKSYDDRTEFR